MSTTTDNLPDNEQALPEIGSWYAMLEDQSVTFLVTDVDETLENIAIEYSDGYSDEIDHETWLQWSPQTIELGQEAFDENDYDQMLDSITASIQEDTSNFEDDSFAA